MKKKQTIISTRAPKTQRAKKSQNAQKPIPQINLGRVPRGVPQGDRKGFKSKRITVTQNEYLADVSSQGADFSIAARFPLNPGLALSFPWLSKQAAQYEKYIFKAVTFYYTPMVTQYVSTANTGKVLMSCDYDAADAAPVNKQVMEDTDPHADGMPYQTLNLKLNPYQLHEMSVAKFVRTGPVPGGTDVKTYDAGNVWIATVGQSASGLIGELRVEYTVELLVPSLYTGLTVTNNSVSYSVNPAAVNITTSSTWQSFVLTAPGSNLDGLGGQGWGTSTVTFPPGAYMIYASGSFANASNSINTVGLRILIDGANLPGVPTQNTLAGATWFVTQCNDQGFFVPANPWTLQVQLFANWTSGTCTGAVQVTVQAV